MAQASTFDSDGRTIVVDIAKGPSANNLCKCLYDGRMLVRHVDRLIPLDQEAQKLLGVGDSKRSPSSDA